MLENQVYDGELHLTQICKYYVGDHMGKVDTGLTVQQ